MYRSLLAKLAVTLGVVTINVSAHAQLSLPCPSSPFIAQPRPFGPSGPISLSGTGTPFFMVSPRGITPGYLGPNGPYRLPSTPYEAQVYPDANPFGSTPSGSMFAPFSQTTSSGARPTPEQIGAMNNASIGTANAPIARTSDSFDVRIDKDNRLIIRWFGDPRTVAQIRTALLDKDKMVLKQERITRLPAEARMVITSRTAYYQIYVEYINGTVTSVVSPL